jgi:alpha-maltose-1-phosphate synthase
LTITYTAPNRAHHYAYAKILAEAGLLKAFVSGFSRFSPRAALPEIGNRLIRADHVQNFFLASQKLRLPEVLTDELMLLTKLWMDNCSRKPAENSDLFLFYSGTGLNTLRLVRQQGIRTMVEAVNCHVLIQEEILEDEYRRLRIPFRPFHRRDVRRRLAEYDEADAILIPSEFVRQSFLGRGFNREKLFKVPYGFNLVPSPEISRSRSDRFVVLYVGQIAIRKGLRYLFFAFERLQHPQKELWIVGPKAAVTGIEHLEPPRGTTFLGVLKGDELANAYSQSSVFVLPSLEEGLALVVGEAISFGLPVIATVHTGAADIFDNGVQGWQVPIRDPEAIAERLQQLADDAAMRHEMSDRALERSRQLGGWQNTGKLLLEALRSVVGTDSG